MVFLRLMSNRRFWLLWFGQTVSVLGDWFNVVALRSFVYGRTGSSSALGLLGVIQALPAVLLGLPAGVLVDRWDRRTIMIQADLVRGCLMLWLSVSTNVVHAYWITLVVGIATLLFEPARGALLPNIVDKDSLLEANAWLEGSYTAAKLVGPAAAGFVIPWGGASLAFRLNALSFFASAIALAMMGAVPLASAGAGPRGRRVIADVGYVWSFVRRSPVLSAVFQTVAGTSFGSGCINVLLLVYSHELLQMGDRGYGILVSAIGAGMVVGVLITKRLAESCRREMMFAAAVLVTGALFGLIGLTSMASIALTAVFLGGIGYGMSSVTGQTLLQQWSPDEVRGRVLALVRSAMQSASLVSAMVAGLLADRFGVGAVLVTAGVLVTCSGLLGFMRLRCQVPCGMAHSPPAGDP